MNVSSTGDVYYDPYNVEICANPYPVFRWLRGRRRFTTTSSTASIR